ncbi:NADH dehydrogenase [ubiquinone] 1 beta subcomplex subunit 9 [Plecturocebus cupreus]
MAFSAPAAFSTPVAYLTHQQKVLRLYKRALRHLESWCVHRDKYRYFACLMRARFEEHKNEKDMMKATLLLKEAEEEFWHRQHPQPYIFPDSPGGTSYERYECYKLPENCLDAWHPSEKAMYPDYFAKREKWKKLRRESWEREIKQLEEETPPGGPLTEALPPARKEGDLPPLWWHIVTRPRERPV